MIRAPAILLGLLLTSGNALAQFGISGGGLFNTQKPPATGALPTISLGPASTPNVRGGLTGYTPTSLTISWRTNVPTIGWISYGLDANHGSYVRESTYGTTHSLTMSGLTANTDYDYVVFAYDSFGRATQTSAMQVTTADPVPLKTLVAGYGGEIGLTAADINVTSAYDLSLMPADAVYNYEMTHTNFENSDKPSFCCTDPATLLNYDTSYVDGLRSARFPTLKWRFHTVAWENAYSTRYPLAWSNALTSGTWQSQLEYRVDHLMTAYNNFTTGGGAGWLELDVFTEQYWINPPYYYQNFNGGQDFYDLSGLNGSFWTKVFDRFVTDSLGSGVQLGWNNFGLWENTNNWGAATPPPGFSTQYQHKQTYDVALQNVQDYLKAGGRMDWWGMEFHTCPAFMESDEDLKWMILDIRRLGITPALSEINARIDVACMPTTSGLPGETQGTRDIPSEQFTSHYLTRVIYDLMIYGGLKHINFWDQPTTGPLPKWGFTPWNFNVKTPWYYDVHKLLTDVQPATSWPRARRISFINKMPPYVTTSQVASGLCDATVYSGCLNQIGSPGLISWPWTLYVYRADRFDTVHDFAQTAWTMDIQWYAQGSTGGDIFKAVDASANALILVHWDASTGNVTVSFNGGAPIDLGVHALPNNFHALVITKNGNNFLMSLDAGAVHNATHTIAAIENLQWLDNTGTGDLLNQVNLTTFDVYEASSIITDATAMMALSVFKDNSPIWTVEAITNWVVP